MNYNTIPADKVAAAEQFAETQFAEFWEAEAKEVEDVFHPLWQREISGEINRWEFDSAIFKLIIEYQDKHHHLASLSRELTCYNFHNLARTVEDYAKHAYIDLYQQFH